MSHLPTWRTHESVTIEILVSSSFVIHFLCYHLTCRRHLTTIVISRNVSLNCSVREFTERQLLSRNTHRFDFIFTYYFLFFFLHFWHFEDFFIMVFCMRSMARNISHSIPLLQFRWLKRRSDRRCLCIKARDFTALCYLIKTKNSRFS